MSNSSRPPALLNYIGTVQLRHMVAGISGGVVSTLLLHPLDLLKIRSDTAGAGGGANNLDIISLGLLWTMVGQDVLDTPTSGTR